MTLNPHKILAALATLAAALALAPSPTLRAQAFPSALSPSETILGEPMDDEGEGQIIGQVDGNQYLSPTGAFRVTIPVLPELGGHIDDNPNVVTFQDLFGEHASIGCFPMTDTFRAEEAKRGRKDFLVWFFQNHIQADFARTLPGTSADPNARFINGTQGGTLFTQLLMPDGSVFAERVFIFPPNPPHIAKRGNYLFINNDNIYVISTELAERIFEYSTYKKTPTEEEDILRRRLSEILSHITFENRRADAPATAPAPGNIAPAPATNTLETPTITFPGATAPSGTSIK